MNAKVIKELEKNPVYLKCLYGLIKDLNDDCVKEIKMELSTNEATPLDILERLVKDDDVSVRLNVIKLKSASEQIIMCGLKDPDASVRLATLKNKPTGEDELLMLIKDTDTEVSQFARKLLKSRL